MSAEIYVTGSSGVLGCEILDHLTAIAGGKRIVTGVARRGLPGGRQALAQIVTPEVLCPDWLKAGDRTATIVHCAGLASPRVPFDDFADLSRREIEPQIAFAEALAARGWAGHLVYVSSAGVYGDSDDLPIPEAAPMQPKSFYALQKMAVEQGLVWLANRHGFRLTILRLANAYGSPLAGPRYGVVNILLDALETGAPFKLFGTGESLRDYIHVSDFCRAVERVCTLPLPDRITTLNIGTGQGTSLARLVALVQEVTGRPLTLQREPLASEVKSSVLGIDRAKALLGWAPTVGIDEGLRRTVAALG
ncbi:NAD-dependent epimerase/dehydratase family protein [Salipiger sp. P9]|uniref:NAD-dependent epimerase/dehydratase family protein n=1 Tax=Salipiger pentaromativorans TaxID=2943193 RepID=UPI0021580242|nr:NAD-dependent epimerase/dehydratase family protein [Salipiger pentaromativorans]MCR8546754.1 NAD-dependent epimerase/dehydratase family protein [Salipiger pentaromativorans]